MDDERQITETAKREETEVLEGELIVPGRSPRSQRGVRRILSRLALAVTMAIGGTVMVVAGLLLILTLIGAPLGIILVVLGIGAGSSGLWLLLGPGAGGFRVDVRKRK